LHQRQQVGILSFNASAGSLFNMQPLATPHAVRKQITLDFHTCYWQTTQGQATIQAVRWTRPHFSLDCLESAAFNQSLKAAARSTGVGAMPAMDTSKSWIFQCGHRTFQFHMSGHLENLELSMLGSLPFDQKE